MGVIFVRRVFIFCLVIAGGNPEGSEVHPAQYPGDARCARAPPYDDAGEDGVCPDAVRGTRGSPQ